MLCNNYSLCSLFYYGWSNNSYIGIYWNLIIIPTKSFEKYCENGNRFYLRNNSSFKFFSIHEKKNKQAHYSIKSISFQYFIKIKYLSFLTSFTEAKNIIPAIFLGGGPFRCWITGCRAVSASDISTLFLFPNFYSFYEL